MHPSLNTNCFERAGMTKSDRRLPHDAKDPGSIPATVRVLIFLHCTHDHHRHHKKLAFLQCILGKTTDDISERLKALL